MADQSAHIPGRLWDFVPRAWDLWDFRVSAWIREGVDVMDPFWRAVRWITEEPAGIALFYFGVFLLWYLSGSRTMARLRGGAGTFGFLLAALGLSDFLAYRILKRSFGRLQPGSLVYVEGLPQKICFPSSHMFSTTVAWTFLWAISKPAIRTRYRPAFVLGAMLTLFVGYSRVVFAEHYFLDVVFGGLMGAPLGGLLAALYKRAQIRWGAGGAA